MSHGYFQKGLNSAIGVQYFVVDAALTTREMAERVIAELGLDISYSALRTSVVFKVVQALRHAKRRKLVRMIEKRKGMYV